MATQNSFNFNEALPLQTLTNQNRQAVALDFLWMNSLPEYFRNFEKRRFKLLILSWFGMAIAVLTGSLVTLAVADMRQLQVLIILGIGLTVTYLSQKSGVSIKTFSVKILVITMLLLLPLYFGMIIIGQLIVPAVGQTIAAMLAGITFAIVVYSLSVIERRIYLRKTASEKSK